MARIRARNQLLHEEHGNGLSYFRAKCLNFYEHSRTQYAIAILILLAFAVDIGEAQLLPTEESLLAPMFTFSELALTLLFTLELLLHLFAKGLDFWRQAANLFDTLVVFVSIASLITRLSGIQGLPNIKMFRLIRVVRVVRLFRRFESLNRIIKAISASVLPVSNALFVLLVFTVRKPRQTALLSSRGLKLFSEVFPKG